MIIRGLDGEIHKDANTVFQEQFVKTKQSVFTYEVFKTEEPLHMYMNTTEQ